MYAIYARQSVDRADSISVESQVEFCQYEVRGEPCQEYIDKGYSGKNTDRPHFQDMLRDIEKGLISKVVVYKLDRISRSILDFSNMMNQFQKYGVEFISSTEKFDTSTPMGRAMLNICIVFAQLERETIQKRVADAYYSRSQKSFYMGGQIPYGYRREAAVIQGIKTSRFVIQREEAEQVRLMFELYADPTMSYADIIRYFRDHNIPYKGKPLDKTTLARVLRNPVYVRADLDVYEFFKNQGAVVVNDAADFTGTNGCYLYNRRESKSRKSLVAGHMLVLAPHEGIVPSDVWLKCRLRCLNNKAFQMGRKVCNTWLAGKIKCGNCGYALVAHRQKGKRFHYLFCRRHIDNEACAGGGTIHIDEFEDLIYRMMVEKLKEFQTLTGGGDTPQVNPRVTAIRAELAQVEADIGKLVDSLTGANDVLIGYVNVKIAQLDGRKQELTKELAECSADTLDREQVERISGYLDDWENVGFDDKRTVLDNLVQVIRATSDRVEIKWKI